MATNNLDTATYIEGQVLGACLMNNDLIPAAQLWVTPQDFVIARNGRIWAAMVDCFTKDGVVDTTTLTHYFNTRSQLAEMGGSVYFSQLVAEVEPASYRGANGQVYARLLHRLATRRMGTGLAAKITSLFANPEIDATEVLFQLDRMVADFIGQRMGADANLVWLGDAAAGVVAKLRSDGGYLTGVPTGFKTIDSITGGLAGGNIMAVCGAPKFGKSTFALQVCIQAAKTFLHRQSNEAALIISLEMPAEQHGFRAVSYQAEINSQLLRHGTTLSENQWGMLDFAVGWLQDYPVAIDDKPGQTAAQICTKARAFKAITGKTLGLLMVDFLQLVAAEGGESEYNKINDAMEQLLQLARTMNIPILLLTQPNREVQHRDNPELFLSDLHGSSNIEKIASVVVLLYGDADATYASELDVTVKIPANRHGPPYKGKCLTYNRTIYTFYDK